MRQKFLLTMLLLLSIAASIAVFAKDSFEIKLNPVEVELGKTATLEFHLTNENAFVGFQADVTLPEGITVEEKGAVTLSPDRADAKDYNLNYKVFDNGKVRIAAFSGSHTAISGNDGVLVKMEVTVTKDYKGGKDGEIKLSDIIFTNLKNEDVTKDFEPTSVTPEVKLTALAFRREAVTLNLDVNETVTLVPNYTPEVATNKTVTWKSSDESVATVSEGKVTPLKVGTTDITATSSNGLVATCKVTVKTNYVSVTSIAVSPTTLELTEGDSGKLTATILPENADDPSVSWHSSNESVATVDENGDVTAVAAGTATITAESSNTKTATCEVTVKAKTYEVTSVTLDQTTLSLAKGETGSLTATVAPENATDKTLTWTSSDETVATVDANGKVTAVAGGNATITATSTNGKTATCEVTVTIAVTKITLDKTTVSIAEGESKYLVAKVAPADATDMNINWSSSDEKIATVDKFGKVTAIAAGTTKITATSKSNPAISASGTVTVTAKDPAEVTITWPMAAEDAINLTPVISAGVEGLTAGAAVVGSELSATRALTYNGADFAAFQPKENVKEVTEGHSVTFSIEVAEGYTFIPTGIDYIANVMGTNYGNYDLKYTWNGKTEKLQSDFHPNRNNAANGYFSSESLSIANATAGSGKFEVTFSVYNLDATKELGLSDVIVRGKFVKKIAVTGITLGLTEATIVEGKSLTLVANVTPSDATDKTVTWSTSNADVATVDENGKVTAVAVGTATITAKAGEFTATCAITVEENLESVSNLPVKMTYVCGKYKEDDETVTDHSNDSYGEIPAGTTAITGYNKISNGEVGWYNESWGRNFITYLQVDASSINGKILSATLSFEGSGSTDSKRIQIYQVGYNSSVWSENMTLETADKSITVMGDAQWGTSKSAKTFDKYNFNIIDALNEATKEGNDGKVTILICAVYGDSKNNGAAGGYIKNPVVSVNWSKEPTYNVTFKEKNDVKDVKVTVDDSDVTNGTSLLKGTYSYTATAPHYQNFTGNFTVVDKDVEVEFEMTPKAIWNYSVVNNVNDEVKTGTTPEGESANVYFSKYALAKDGSVWSREVANNTSHVVTITPDKDGYVYTLEYSETDMKDGIFFKEAEDEYYNNVLTATGTTADRGSNRQGGYTDEPSAKLYTLLPGTYNVEIGAIGPASNGAVLVVKAGEETIITTSALYSTLGKYRTETPVTVTTETDLTIEGTNKTNVLDYILITGKADVEATADYKVIFVDENGTEIKDAVSGNGIVGTSIQVSADDTKDFEKDGVTYIYDGFEPKNPTIAADGKTVVTVKYHKQNKVTYTVKFVDENGEPLKEPETLTGDAGSKIDLAEYVNGIVVDGKVYFFVKASYAPEGETVAEGKVVTITFEPSSKLPYSRTESDWTAADLTDWANDNAQYVTQTIEDGIKMNATNSEWNATKGVSFTENSIVSLTATLNGGNASGRAGSYDFLKLGDVEVRLYGQDQKATVKIGETETNLTGFKRGADYTISMTIDQAFRAVSVTVAGGASGEVEGKIKEALPNYVVVGHFKAGKENYGVTEILKNISISEEIQTVATADYIVNYVCDDEIIKSEEGIAVIGSEITADATLTIDDQKYYLAEGATTALTVEADADNILNVNMRKAYVYKYIVKNNVNEETINGECIEGESATVPFSKYIVAENGTVWTRKANSSNPWYGVTFTPDADKYTVNLEYVVATETIKAENEGEEDIVKEITDGIFFSEGENIEGMTTATGSNASIRCSNAAGGYADEAVTLYTLPAGTYKVRLGVWGNAGNTFIAKAGEKEILTAATTGNWFEAVSKEFTLETETALTFEGAASSKPLDYVLITGSLKEIVNSVVIDTKDLAPEYTIGDTFKLKATVDSDNSSADPQVTWTSSKPTVATVDKAGNVKVVGPGNVRITASYGGKSASCSIKCYPQVGDAKMDGGITIDDAVEITNFVVGKKTAPANWDKDEWTEFFTRAANANQDKDGKISFADASAAVSISLTQPLETPAQNRVAAAYDNDDMDALVVGGISAADGRYSIPVTLDNTMEYVALQADIILPAGMRVEVKEGSRIAGSHIMATHKFADNHIRVALYNLGNTAFADNDAPIIEIIANGMIADNEEIAICNIIAADTDANKFVLASKATETNGIEAIEFDGNAPVKVYDLNGRYISDKVEGLEQGIYIFRQGNNAKKVRIR